MAEGSAHAARLVWLRFFSHAARFPRWRSIDAARAARAVLEGTQLDEKSPSVIESGVHARWWRSYSLHNLSLRSAAHAVVIGVVLLIALLAGDVVVPSDSWLAPGVRAAWMAARDASDVRVQRQLTLSAESDTSEIGLPVAPAWSEQIEPAFSEIHVLSEGETLGQVAAQYHVSVASLFWANDLGESPLFAAGQELRIPRMSGVPYVIEASATLESIAAQFHVRPQAILLFKANGLRDDQPLPVGREIFIPGGLRDYPAEYLAQHGGEQGIAAMRAVVAGTVQETDTNLRTGPGREYPRLGYLAAGQRMKLLARHGTWVKVDSEAGGVGWVRGDLLGLSDANIVTLAETNDFPPPPPRWIWPTQGVITSPFGWRSAPWRMFHDGVDIANDAGTRIYAARAGMVFEAGWCSGFGYCVKIDHGDGVTTIYGHMLKRPPIHRGDSVSVGDLIGYMGSTYDARGGGYSTGVHLHFTVTVNGKAVNPLKFLP